jgi:predicted MPP superfamily phosphohydrolase
MSSVLLVAGALLGVIALHAVLVAPFRLDVSVVQAPVAGLHPSLDGYTIAVLADLHHHPLTPLAHMRRAASAAAAARPDAVVLLGDYGASFKWKLPARANRWLYRHSLDELTPVLRTLRAPDGVLAVLGNHDYWFDADAVARWLDGLGVRVLDNDCVVVHRGAGALAIGGVADASEGRVDTAGGCGRVAADVPRVVLSHHPDAILDLAPGVRVDLVLAGHTHGGQVVIPFIGAPIRLARVCGWKTAGGWVPNERAPLYISRGVGSQVPVRFWCTPEVVIVRLRSAPAAGGPAGQPAQQPV